MTAPQGGPGGDQDRASYRVDLFCIFFVFAIDISKRCLIYIGMSKIKNETRGDVMNEDNEAGIRHHASILAGIASNPIAGESEQRKAQLLISMLARVTLIQFHLNELLHEIEFKFED